MAGATRANVVRLLMPVALLLLFGGNGAAQTKYDVVDAHAKFGNDCATCHGSASPPVAPESKACLACHGLYEAVAAKTKAMTPNPHASHKGDVPCSDCHSSHGNARLACNDCHAFKQFKLK